MTQYKYDDTMKFRFTKNENNEYHSFDDEPSLEYLDGSIISWHKNGVLHRIDNPALIRTLINGNKLEEYYNDGKLHSPNINTPACIDNGVKKIYYMGEELIQEENELLIKYINGCSICKTIASGLIFYNNYYYNKTFYNKKLNKIYCRKCNKLNELETTNFKIKSFTNLEILNMIKDYYNKNHFNNKFININNINEHQITYQNDPNFIFLSYYKYKKNIDHRDGIGKIENGNQIEFRLIEYNNELYVPSLLNENILNLFDDEGKFNIDNIYIEFTNEKILDSYKCTNTNEYKNETFIGPYTFALNISGLKVLCGICDSENNIYEHDSKFITSYIRNKTKCKTCKKEDYEDNMGSHSSTPNIFYCNRCIMKL